MAKYILLEDVTLTFQNNPQFNRYWAALDPAPVLLELGKTYYVMWEGTEWVCTAADGSDAIPGMTFIGNAEDFGIPGNGEPFVIGSSAELGLNLLSTEDQEPVTRTISLSVEEAVPSATVKLKNYSGVEVTYEAVPKVWLASGENEGGSQNLVPFTYGEAREGVEIVPNFVAGDMRMYMPNGYMARSAVVKMPETLIPGNIVAGVKIAGVEGSYEGIIPVTETPTVDADFAGGDMVIQPGEGKLLESVTVRKPADLIPENIKYGVDIAGIIGALTGTGTDTGGDAGTGGGSGTTGSMLKIKSGNYKVNSSGNPATVSHGLGTMPDLVIVQYSGWYMGSTEEFVNGMYLMSTWAMKDDFGSGWLGGTVIPGMGTSRGEDDITVTSTISVYCPNDEVFKFGASSGNGMLVPGANYAWIAISGLGSAAQPEDLCYVTFMSYDGLTFLGKKAVARGDDCADPISRGLFPTPTRESTPQYTYTFAGWATEANGGLDANALKAVTEDRTVYANFASVLRYYTITFYDSDGTTVLATKSVAYGSVPSYEPEKQGVTFSNWVPEPVAVTEATSYQAVWSEAPSFKASDWATIKQLCDEGKASECFAVGDKRAVPLNYSDGTTETINVTIVDMNNYTSQSSGTKAPLTIMFDNIVEITPTIIGSGSPYPIMDGTTMKTVLNEVLTAMPEDLQAVIASVKVDDWSNKYYSLFLPNFINLGLNNSFSNASNFGYSSKFKHFTNGASIKRTKLTDASVDDYWTCSSSKPSASSSTNYYLCVDESKALSSAQPSSASHGVVPCFCI